MSEILTLTPPKISRKQVLRYAGSRGETPEMETLLDECLVECETVFSYKVCYEELPLRISGTECTIGEFSVVSTDLARNLSGCESVLLFAATIGLGLDRLVGKYSRISPTKAVFFNAIGTERIEALCDAFMAQLTEEKGLLPRPRFSPGYGDLPLSVQKDIFRILGCTKKIGVFLNDSLLMSPQKSVTALWGWTSNEV